MTEDIVRQIVGLQEGSGLAQAVAKRDDIMQMTQRTHDAALKPAEPGGLTHAERAALSCRIAKLNNDSDFERHFERLMEQADAPDSVVRIADIWFDGGGDIRQKALIRHVDLIAHDPKRASRRDIELLKEAGVAEADIVRLSELVAFVSYQIRVAFGLKLMGGLA